MAMSLGCYNVTIIIMLIVSFQEKNWDWQAETNSQKKKYFNDTLK